MHLVVGDKEPKKAGTPCMRGKSVRHAPCMKGKSASNGLAHLALGERAPTLLEEEKELGETSNSTHFS